MLWGDPLWELAGPSHSGCRVTGRGLPYGDMVWGACAGPGESAPVGLGGPVSLSVVGRECRLLDGGGNKWPYATDTNPRRGPLAEARATRTKTTRPNQLLAELWLVAQGSS